MSYYSGYGYSHSGRFQAPAPNPARSAKKAVQDGSRATVEYILTAAAQVFEEAGCAAPS